jgi:hypothetical protein
LTDFATSPLHRSSAPRADVPAAQSPAAATAPVSPAPAAVPLWRRVADAVVASHREAVPF